MLFFIRHLIKKCVFHQMTRFKSGVIILYRFNIVNAIYNWYFGGVLLEISDIYIKTTRNVTVWNGTKDRTTGRTWFGVFRLLTNNAKHSCCC